MKLDKHSKTIEVISYPSAENPFAVIYKPQGIPSAPLKESEEFCALNQTAELFPEILSVKGRKEIEKGLVHRIDTATDGLLLVALNQSFYDYILNEQIAGRFMKTYSACSNYVYNYKKIMQGFPDIKYSDEICRLQQNESMKFSVSSYFRAFGPGRKEVRPVIENDSKAASKKSGTTLYSTEINVKKTCHYYECKCRIANGFRHQVRNHLAWCNLPIIGDQLYNPEYSENDEFCFTASGLEFIHPETKEKIIFRI